MSNPNIFQKVKLKKPGKSRFDLTHDVKLTAEMGDLVPVCCMETVPGDKFNIGAESVIRMAPLVAPIMHRLDAYIHYFFVPNRILWPNWENFITNPSSGIQPPVINIDPYLNQPVYKRQRKLADYFGIPQSVSNQRVSAFPFAAYQKIYNEYYRDQNLVPMERWQLTDGLNHSEQEQMLNIRRRAWEHDYFTSALPWAQKVGGVEIPLGNVEFIEDAPYGYFRKSDGTPAAAGQLTTTAPPDVDGYSVNANGERVNYDPNGSLGIEATTINDLRRAFRLQEFLERLAIGGSRTKEVIKAMFGVNSSDARLQRPEYITGCKTPIVISEVLNTTGETGGLAQGNMSGHGLAVIDKGKNGYYCEEHGYIIGIMSLMPKTAYQQGLPKHFMREDALDYYWPQFANLGEQPVKAREIYIDALDPDKVFGYQSRYSEYKYIPSMVAGDFRTSLSHWHLGRQFANEPELNRDFIECNPRKNIFAVMDNTVDSFYIHVLNKVDAIRPMPYFGTPTI